MFCSFTKTVFQKLPMVASVVVRKKKFKRINTKILFRQASHKLVEVLRMVTARALVVLSGSFTSQIETGPTLT